MPNLPPYVWKAQFKQGSTWYNLPDVQAVDIMRGRRLQIDDYGIDNATLLTRNQSGWTTAPKLGDQISVYIYAPGYVVGTNNGVAVYDGKIYVCDTNTTVIALNAASTVPAPMLISGPRRARSSDQMRSSRLPVAGTGGAAGCAATASS